MERDRHPAWDRSMTLDFFPPDDPRWLDFLKGAPHQFYHWPGYARLWAEEEQGHAEAVLVSEGDNYFFLPYLLVSLAGVDGLLDGQSDAYWDLRSPYGYPGPLVRANSGEFLTRALRGWMDALRQR